MGEALDSQGATQTAQAPQAPQKDNTDSVEPPDRQEMLYQGSHAPDLGGDGFRWQKLRRPLGRLHHRGVRRLFRHRDVLPQSSL